MSKWEMVKLGELGEAFIGLTYKPENVVKEGIIVLRSGNIQNGSLNLSDIVKVDKAVKNKLLVKNGDILMCSRNGSAKLVGKSVLIKDLSVRMTFGAFMMVYRSEYNPYISYFFHSLAFRRQLSKSATTTINQITKEMLNEVLIPLPPLDEQKQIANNLDHASDLIKLYKEQLTELNKLIQSVFYEMFGDPVTNEKGWGIKKLGRLAKLKAGKNIKANQLFKQDELYKYPCYGGNGIRGYVDKMSHVGPLSLIGRQGALCGNIQFATGEFFATEHAVVVTPNISIESLFLYYVLKFLDLNRLQTGAAQPGLNINILSEVDILIPPLSLQNRFAEIVAAIEAQKAQVQTALEEAQTLFDSLMQQYFA